MHNYTITCYVCLKGHYAHTDLQINVPSLFQTCIDQNVAPHTKCTDNYRVKIFQSKVCKKFAIDTLPRWYHLQCCEVWTI